MKRIIYIFIITCAIMTMFVGFIYAKIMPDTDGDGLSDYEEKIIYKTNPLNPDTDGDTYLDWLEIFHGYSPTKGYASRLLEVRLDVPYIHESPDHSWTGPWKNGCEEASIAMVENYYLGKNKVGVQEAMNFMSWLFDEQDKLWGSNSDADAYRANKIINDFMSRRLY